MKFMKLGSKSDAFRSDGSFIKFVASELPTDVVILLEALSNSTLPPILNAFEFLDHEQHLRALGYWRWPLESKDRGCWEIETDMRNCYPKLFGTSWSSSPKHSRKRDS